MTWNYRVMDYGDGECGLHEVHYRKDGTVEGWTDRACGFVGESVWSVRRQMIRAFLDTFRRAPLTPPCDPRYIVTPAGKAALRGGE